MKQIKRSPFAIAFLLSCVLHAGLLVDLVLFQGRLTLGTPANASGPSVVFVNSNPTSKVVHSRAQKVVGDVPVKKLHHEKNLEIPEQQEAPMANQAQSSEGNGSSQNASAGGAPASALSQYSAELATVLNKAKTYPRAAVLRNEEGLVVLVLKIRSNGALENVNLKTGSPFEILNQSALETVRHISMFPAPPVANGSEIEITVPLRYKIERH